jgi:hypothetical protein
MTDTIIMMAALVAAIAWTIYLQRVVNKLTRRLTITGRRLHSARVTLADTKQDNEYLDNEVEVLKSILFDVAKGEADVWIENGELRGKKRITGNTQIH